MTYEVDVPTVEPTLAKSKAYSRIFETWAASRLHERAEDKKLMAEHFAEHDFLVGTDMDPATVPRGNVASILVNQGTSPNQIVFEALQWIEKQAPTQPDDHRVFHITWYSVGALVPATLHEFRQDHPELSAATHVHLFPGDVDLQLQAMISKEAHEYAAKIRRRFTYMILSSHAFDLDAGNIRFQFDREIPMQKATALLEARHKFLFLDPTKFTSDGEVGYSLAELLASSTDSVTIYTVTSSQNQAIINGFRKLGATLLISDSTGDIPPKLLRLVIVGSDKDGTLTEKITGVPISMSRA